MNFTNFHNELSKTTEINVVHKESSKLMKLLSFILFFNKDFMTMYITTIGNTVYYPKKLLEEERSSVLVLAHEYMHMMDNKRFKALYSIMYLFPQILGALALLSVFALFNTSFLWFLLALMFVAPIPSIGRKYIEIRGYKMSLYIINLYLNKNNTTPEHKDKVLKKVAKQCDKYFTTSAYYWMWPTGVKKELLAFTEVLKDTDTIPDKTNAFENVKNAFNKM